MHVDVHWKTRQTSGGQPAERPPDSPVGLPGLSVIDGTSTGPNVPPEHQQFHGGADNDARVEVMVQTTSCSAASAPLAFGIDWFAAEVGQQRSIGELWMPTPRPGAVSHRSEAHEDHQVWRCCHANCTANGARRQALVPAFLPVLRHRTLGRVAPHTLMTTFPRACPSSRYRMASGASRSG